MHAHPHFLLFFFNDTATTEIYTLSLHDALPIFKGTRSRFRQGLIVAQVALTVVLLTGSGLLIRSLVKVLSVEKGDRKSTRLNSSHGYISYAVFCLKKKKEIFDMRRHDLVSAHTH